MLSEDNGTHYSYAQNPKKLNAWAVRMARSVVKKFPDRVPVLIYTGMSGIAYATALSGAIATQYPTYKFMLTYVRKDGESSHGSRIERNPDVTFPPSAVGLFVDDFVESGQTVEDVTRKLNSTVNPIRLEYMCVGKNIHKDERVFSVRRITNASGFPVRCA